MTDKCEICGKPIAESQRFCSEKCVKEHYGDIKNLQRTEDKKPENKAEVFKIELDLLDKSVSKRVELGLSRGATVRGIVTGFDERYGKIAIAVKENNQTKTVIVRLGYIVSFAVYD